MSNKEALLFQELVFKKADAETDEIKETFFSNRKKRGICATPYFVRGGFSSNKKRKLFGNLENIKRKQYAGGCNKN